MEIMSTHSLQPHTYCLCLTVQDKSKESLLNHNLQKY